jgi:succinate-semialdehyde dehydrogenase/glutarate-semialdehyde dehydrogenase
MADHPALNLLIAGEALAGDGREAQDVIDPATGETIGRVPHATAADLDRALEAAERGFKTWRNTSADQRTAILLKAAALIRERAPAIGEALTRDQGKPIKEAIGETV